MNQSITEFNININPSFNDVIPIVNNGETKQLSLSGLTIFMGPHIESPNNEITGGTYSAGTAVFTNNTGGTFSVSGFSTGSTSVDTYVTGFTYSNNVLSIINSTGGTNSVVINTMSGLTVNGGISATTFYGDGSHLSGISTTDITITGGTYSAGTAVFTNNTGGTFSVSGFSTGSTSSVSTLKTQNNITFTNINGDYFGTVISPITGALTFDSTNAVRGGIAIVYYSNATLNIPSTWLTVGTFMPSQLNKLYLERDGEGYVTCNIVASLIDITPPSTIGTLIITNE